MVKKYCSRCSGLLTEKLVEGRQRLYCSSCNIPIYENPIPATAALVVDKKDNILLVKRSVAPGKGLWCLPGGFMEIGESSEECVLRELKEETALEGKIERFLSIEISVGSLYPEVMVIAYLIKEVKGKPKAYDDAEEVDFFSIGRLPKIAFLSHLKIIERFREEKKSIIPQVGLYVITSNDHENVAEFACQAGAKILQYRDKEASLREKISLAKKLRIITRNSGTLFIINDHIDLAVISEADGVHLGQEDLSVQEARKIVGNSMIIGKSTHSLQQALQEQENGADYIAIGPVFATPTKLDYPAVGLETVREVMKRIKIPVVAIGGINRKNMNQIAEVGVKNIAIVRDLQKNTYEVVKEVNDYLFYQDG